MATSGDSSQGSAPIPPLQQPSFNTLQFGTMTDSQLRQTINQLSHAASGTQYQAYAAPTPQRTAGKCPLPTLSPISSFRSSRRRKQLTRKILPIGLHLRLLHPARPHGAAALREAAILRLRQRPLRHPHRLPSHTYNLPRTSHNPRFP